jgi:two-component sensor histidine kinase
LTYRKNKVTLIYRDNGPGLPEDFDLNKNASLGMQLIKLLTEQINGDLKINQANPISYCITFAKDVAKR